MIKALENLSDRITVNYEGEPCYDIFFSKDFSEIGNELKKFNIENIREMDLIAVISEIIEYAMFRVDKVQPVIEFNCGNNLEDLIIDVEYKAVNSNSNKDKLTVINSVVEKYDGAIVVNKDDNKEEVIVMLSNI